MLGLSAGCCLCLWQSAAKAIVQQHIENETKSSWWAREDKTPVLIWSLLKSEVALHLRQNNAVMDTELDGVPWLVVSKTLAIGCGSDPMVKSPLASVFRNFVGPVPASRAQENITERLCSGQDVHPIIHVFLMLVHCLNLLYMVTFKVWQIMDDSSYKPELVRCKSRGWTVNWEKNDWTGWWWTSTGPEV